MKRTKKGISLLLSVLMVISCFIGLPVVSVGAEEVTYSLAGTPEEIFGGTWDASNISTDMALGKDGKYSITLPAVQPVENAEFKVVTNHSWDNEAYGDEKGNNVVFNVTEECDVTVTFDPDTKEVTVSGAHVEQPKGLEIKVVRAVGNGQDTWLNDSNWDPDDDINNMKEVAPKVYEITFDEVEEDLNYQIKFAINGGWANNFGAPSDGYVCPNATPFDAAFNGKNIYVHVDESDATVVARLDLSNFDYNTKEGAKVTITVKTPSNPNPQPQEPTEPQEETPKLSVEATSNMFPVTKQEFDPSTKKLTVCYQVNYPGYSLVNADFEFTYDSSKLTYNKTENTDAGVCPVSNGNITITTPGTPLFGEEGIISGNFSNIMNQLSLSKNGNPVDFLKVVFDVKDGETGTAFMDLQLKYFRICPSNQLPENSSVYIVRKSTLEAGQDVLDNLIPKVVFSSPAVVVPTTAPTQPTVHQHTVVIDKAVVATCKKTGLTEGSHCSVCGEVIKAQEVVPKKAHTVVVDPAVPATCTETGLTEGSHCSVCKTVIKKQETVPATGHTVVVDKAVAATCKKTGLTEGSHCSVCNTVIKAQEVVPKKAHTVVVDPAVPATCTETGLTEGSHCSVCKGVIKRQEVVPATGHTVVVDKAVAATCKKTGLTEGSHCSVCNTVIKAQEVVPKKAHTVVIDPAVPATCTETGLTEGSHCSVCKGVIKRQEVVPATGHTVVVDKAVAATCKKTGLTEGSHCSVCNTVIKAQEVVPKKAHTVVVDKAVAATCHSTGLTEGSHCSVCNTVIKKQEVTPKLEHKIVVDKAVAPTCTNVGKTEGSHCSLCGDVIKAQTFIPALGHNPVMDAAVPATCEHTGLTAGVHCSICGTVFTKQEVTPKLSHTVVVDKGYAATCTKSGLTDGSHCSTCGQVISTRKSIPALGHDYQVVPAVPATHDHTGLTEGVRCTRCGEWLLEQQVIEKLGRIVLIGDVNLDGKVNGQDAGILNRYVSGWSGYDKNIKDWEAADVNRDGKVNGQDAGLLNRYVSGWPNLSKYFIKINV